MKKNRTNKKILFIALVLFLSFFIVSAEASWIIKYTISSNDSFLDQDDSDFVNVYIKYVTTELGAESEKVFNDTTNLILLSEISNPLEVKKNVYDKYEIGDKYIEEQLVSSYYSGNYFCKEYRRVIVTERKREWILSALSYIYKLTFAEQIAITSTPISQNIDSETLYHTYKIKTGSLLNKPSLTRSGYAFSGYLKSNADGTGIKNESFNFNEPITKDTYIFVEWIQLIDGINKDKEHALTNYINGLTSGNNSIFNSSSASFNVADDASYNVSTKYVELGYSGGSGITTIQPNVTVNFALNSGKTNQEATEGASISDTDTSEANSDNYVSLDYTNTNGTPNTMDYDVVLQNDLYVNGNLVIGGITGAYASSATSIQGHIISNYVKLDLNGHNIYVNGTLHSFGYIDDSVGTGKVIVNPGGILKTPFIIYGNQGGNHTLWAYSKGIAPFEHYVMPYVNCEINLISNSSGSGCLDIFTKLNLGSLGFTNFYIKLLGKKVTTDETEKYFIETTAKSGKEGKIVIKPQISNKLKEHYNDYIDKNMVYLKNEFNLYNLDCITNDVSSNVQVFIDGISVMGSIKQSFRLQLSRLSFPISPSWNLNFINSSLNLSQKLVFMPGSSMTMDKDSVLEFDYYTENDVKAIKKFDDISVSSDNIVGLIKKTLPGESKYISGEIFAINENPKAKSGWNYAGYLFGLYNTGCNDYWNYYESASITISGKVNFKTGNSSDAPYKLAGNINISKYTVDGGNIRNWNINELSSLSSSNINIQTYDINICPVNFFWFNSESITVKNNNDSTCSANQYFTSPLISNGKAYIIDNNNKIAGTWNKELGVFTSDTGTNYFLKANNHILKNESDTESQIDDILIPTECEMITDKHLIKEKNTSNYYAYYAGYMVPATINADNTIVVNAKKLTNIDLSANTKYSTNIQIKYVSTIYNNRTISYWTRSQYILNA